MLKKISICGMVCLLSLTVSGQSSFQDSVIRGSLLTPKSVMSPRSMQDGLHYSATRDGKLSLCDYFTGEAKEVIFDPSQYDSTFRFVDYAFSADEKYLLLSTRHQAVYRRSFTAEYWIYDRTTERLQPLSAGGVQQVALFSPDASKVAFVRDNNLFYVDLQAGTETQITQDGRFGEIINGIPDWVYEEEFGFNRAYEWSPDGKFIAFMRFDETRVKQYNMNMFSGELYPQNYAFKYPKAGEENSVVEVHVYELATGHTVKVEVGEDDQYIPRIGWTAQNNLYIYRLNRPQNHFELLQVPVVSGGCGEMAVIYDERNSRYVERVDDDCITFLPDGERFIVRSEKDGYMHLYLYHVREGELNRITSGPWEVASVLDVVDDQVYYMSNETSHLGRDLYRVKLDGSGKKRLTGGDGTYRIAPSKGFNFYISFFTNAQTPLTVSLHDGDGKYLTTLEDNKFLNKRLIDQQIPSKEFFTFRTSTDVELNGYMIKPNDFDPTKQYPVFMIQYSGPGSQRVVDAWGLSWEDVLVREGYLVVCVDGRGTGGRGEDFKKCTYKQLGKYETEDQIEAARWLASQPYVDADRIGIYGWSYGGFMALNCILKGNDVFKMAIAVAPVTSWRFYDTIYTELYNGDPNENPEGYDDNSPIHFADRLKGKLLIIHGTGDDNVHIQNTYEMISRLVAADKKFDMMIYPDKNHAMRGARPDVFERCLDFVRQNL